MTVRTTKHPDPLGARRQPRRTLPDAPRSGRSALPPWMLALLLASPATGQLSYVGVADGEFGPSVRPALQMPTDVAILPDGVVCVVDGVNDRVVRFRSDGTLLDVIARVGDAALQRPVGISADAAGRLWIADSGHGRVIVRAADGGLERIVVLPPAPDGRAPEPTDAAASEDGLGLWVADNDHHRILRLDLASGAWQSFGQRGEALGQWQYPFQLAVASNGDVAITDVVNGRGQLLERNGVPAALIGRFGLNPGQLYRPTGVAFDGESNAWVADSVTGAIQVFRRTGEVIDILRDADGGVMRFAGPLGLAFDADGRLYVTERDANRVLRLVIARRRTPAAPPTPAPPRRLTGQQARACTVCHFDWLPPFSEGRGSELMPRPSSTPQDPVVARSENCLSCHDGSVADSRRRVWLEHGHLTGVSPPESMQVPEGLPLLDGKLACRTCHSAHGPGASQSDISTAVLLRVPNLASELCMMCHVDKTRGPEFGTHPTGGMPWPVPRELIDAGAKVGPNPRELTCQVCHTPHGARHEHLLVMGTSSNQLCVTCHDQMRPGMFREGGPSEHPLSPPVDAEQLAAIHAMGTVVGPGDTLLCLSCHKLHHGHGKRFMLAAPLTDGQMCLACHSQRRDMLGTPHDLRTNFPGERNRLGMTVAEGGPCSACHLFHRYARLATPTSLDPSGECVTCHQQGQCGERKMLDALNHPGATCLQCHNPHEPRHGSFLRAAPQDLCRDCHSEQAMLAGGPHDFHLNPSAWPQAARESCGGCLACHRPHGTEATGLFRVAPAANAPQGDAACLACHWQSGWNAGGGHAALHPRSVAVARLPGELDLPFARSHDNAQLGCRTCHDPHGGLASAKPLLRAAADQGHELCLKCHSDMRAIMHTAHAPQRLERAGLAVSSCGPCHALHGDAATMAAGLRPATRLIGAAADWPDDYAGDAACLGCHSRQGRASVPAIATHPAVPMLALGDDDHVLPLFDRSGGADAQGRIACRTCHLPHGREPPAGVDPHAAGPNLRLQLRAFSPPNTCTTCHGADALRRYLYFHDPERRGPLARNAALLPVTAQGGTN
ncbi:MAG: hypothetical protein LC135_07955 [Phycisphaerae bacterium]|nr:hypothetical protein [Phycisphaerae bacterium]MCZ2399787.1 hypothetical protein [Phycisphaerae bacterium]